MTYSIREMAERIIAIRSACNPAKNQFMWDALTRFADELKQIDREHTRLNDVVKFLEKIGGDGYGGMADYEIALATMREIAPVRKP